MGKGGAKGVKSAITVNRRLDPFGLLARCRTQKQKTAKVFLTNNDCGTLDSDYMVRINRLVISAVEQKET
jgi:hypothetical protein